MVTPHIYTAWALICLSPSSAGDACCDGPAVKDTVVNVLWTLWDLFYLLISKSVCANGR